MSGIKINGGLSAMQAHQFARDPVCLNPDADPLAKGRCEKVTASMVADDYYANHTREECKAEWRIRYDTLKENGQ